MSIGVLGYSFSAMLLFFLGVLLLTSWRGRIEGAYLVTAVMVTCLWAVASVFLQIKEEPLTVITYHILEVGRYVAWFVFLFRLLKALREAGGNDGGLLHYAPVVVFSITIPLFFLNIVAGAMTLKLPWSGMPSLQLLGHLGLAITGLTLIEQLFRNTRPEKRWAVKYLYLGIGSLFVYDFFLYSDALLYRQVDDTLWRTIVGMRPLGSQGVHQCGPGPLGGSGCSQKSQLVCVNLRLPSSGVSYHNFAGCGVVSNRHVGGGILHKAIWRYLG